MNHRTEREVEYNGNPHVVEVHESIRLKDWRHNVDNLLEDLQDVKERAEGEGHLGEIEYEVRTGTSYGDPWADLVLTWYRPMNDAEIARSKREKRYAVSRRINEREEELARLREEAAELAD